MFDSSSENLVVTGVQRTYGESGEQLTQSSWFSPSSHPFWPLSQSDPLHESPAPQIQKVFPGLILKFQPQYQASEAELHSKLQVAANFPDPGISFHMPFPRIIKQLKLFICYIFLFYPSKHVTKFLWILWHFCLEFKHIRYQVCYPCFLFFIFAWNIIFHLSFYFHPSWIIEVSQHSIDLS